MSKENLENALVAKDKVYKTWLYKLVDGKPLGEVFSAEEAQKVLEEDKGWVFNPVELASQELKEDPNFNLAAQTLAKNFNLLENLEHVTDKEVLHELGKEHFGVEIKRNKSLENMKKELLELKELDRQTQPDDQSDNDYKPSAA